MAGFQDFVGRERVTEERCDARPVRGLLALLDRGDVPSEGTEIPLLSHWLFFTPSVTQSRIGADGHPRRGDFLPPVQQPRRMWAASDIAFLGPIRIGDELRKVARIAEIQEKTGKSGTLVFVKVDNVYEANGTPALTETQTLVYRDDPAPDDVPPPPKPAPSAASWSVIVAPDPVLLFRYSAVTFNAHRIHYDARYARDVEGYERPVVHGQLTATLMLQALAANQPKARIRRFAFRAVRPLLCDASYYIEGGDPDADGRVDLWARDAGGALAMSAEAEIET